MNDPTDEPLLAGLRVLDFTRVLSGPYCTRMLADLGARVTKVERPGEGDETRYIGLQFDPQRNDQSAYFARMNAGKRSVAIDLANAGAREVVLDLVRRSDVVIENFSPGVMARYALDYESLRAVRPDLVYCSISGFGQTGPLSSMQAYGHLINAISGMMDLECAGTAAPRASNLQAADVLAGGQAFGAICAALLRRARTGKGAYIDLSMFECLVAADDVNFPVLLNGGTAPRRPRPGMVVHPIGERHVAMQVGGAAQMWPRLAALIGHPELASDPRFATPAARRENWPALQAILGKWLEGFGSVDEAVRVLASSRIPCVPMLTPEEVVVHPHMALREAFPVIDHPVSGSIRVTATPFHLDGAPVAPAGPAPYRIGQDTLEVLRDDLGYDGQRVEELLSRGVVAAG
jgi:CoA:oxalate CoA-transferase